THQKVTQTHSGTATAILDDAYSFAEQKNYPQLPPITVANGDRIDTTCVNNTGSTMMFGESSLDEMCFTGIYRYPARAWGCSRASTTVTLRCKPDEHAAIPVDHVQSRRTRTVAHWDTSWHSRTVEISRAEMTERLRRAAKIRRALRRATIKLMKLGQVALAARELRTPDDAANRSR
ncbi:MAG TPA: hypothetical protein VGO00_09415, partial [Kofleriaceae bacterium]|nr:hypothetical protein [Kofleriaceae bacterium]